MRLAATLTTLETGRGSERQPVALRGTLRDAADAPSEIAIIDISESGFLAELPAGTELPVDARVRVAATPLGTHDAVVVRRDGDCYGFAFARALRPGLAQALDGEQPSTITPFPGQRRPSPAMAAEAPAAALSPRASLVLMIGISAAIWAGLAAVVAGIAFLG